METTYQSCVYLITKYAPKTEHNSLYSKIRTHQVEVLEYLSALEMSDVDTKYFIKVLQNA